MRSKPSTPRVYTADPIYHSVMLTKVINRIMKDGKKSPATKQIYRMMELLKEKTGQDSITIFDQAIENVRPQLEVRARRIGGAAYQVPTPVRGSRKDSLAIRWIVAAARARSSSEYHSFAEKMAAELVDAYNNAGGAIKKKTDTHRMAEANKAFAHFRW